MTPIVGRKIRETRRALGLSQSELARRMGISPAYLNLIEFSKRRIGGKLLRKAAACLDLDPADLDGAEEIRLVNELRDVAADPALRPFSLDPGGVEAFVGRHPDWGAAMARLHRSERTSHERARALSDRLTHDPYLRETVHQMLTQISSIRSTAEILADVPDITDAERTRFHAVLAGESGRLSDVAHALATYFDRADDPGHAATPAEDVERFLLESGNAFPDIEAAAAALVAPAGQDLPARIAALKSSLANGVADETPDETGGPVEARLSALADAVAEAALGPAIEATLETRTSDVGAAAQRHIRRLLRTHAADALLLPARAFAASAIAMRYDIEALAAAWTVGCERVCRRLASLAGTEVDDTVIPQIAYLCANAAGTTIDRRPILDLPFPRHGTACPLWAIYRAFTRPGTVTRQIARFPDGRKMLFVARARRTGASGFQAAGPSGMPPAHVADMIAITPAAAAATVYGDSLDFSTRGPADPVGSHCRVCPRRDCRHRTDDPLVGPDAD